MADIPRNETGTTEGTGRSESLSETASRAQEAAKRQAGQLADDARHVAADVRDAAARRADETRTRAANELSRTARALETAAADLDDRSPQRDLFQRAADGLLELSDAIEGRSLGEMIDELGRLGRRNPTLFLGSAALAGFALARFGRASAPETSAAAAPPYGTYSAYGTPTQPTTVPAEGSSENV
jgi:hypothetical protein